MHNDSTFWCTSDFVLFIKRSQEIQALERNIRYLQASLGRCFARHRVNSMHSSLHFFPNYLEGTGAEKEDGKEDGRRKRTKEGKRQIKVHVRRDAVRLERERSRVHMRAREREQERAGQNVRVTPAHNREEFESPSSGA